DQALLLSVLDQRTRHAILDRARGVARLELAPDPDAGLRTEPPQLDERRVTDRLDDVAVSTAAGPVLEALEGHRFRKCSVGRGACWAPGRRWGACGPRTPRSPLLVVVRV